MDRVKLKVLGLSYTTSPNGAYALILANEEETFRIPVIIGISEAQSIAMQLEKFHTPRPLTHDLIKALTDKLEITLLEVVIYRLDAGVYYSELVFETQNGIVKVDSRTSDAVALSLRYGCDLYTTAEIVERAGIPVKRDEAVNSKVRTEKEKGVDSYTVRELQKLLNEAILNEDYEKASKFRDMLKKQDK